MPLYTVIMLRPDNTTWYETVDARSPEAAVRTAIPQAIQNNMGCPELRLLDVLEGEHMGVLPMPLIPLLDYQEHTGVTRNEEFWQLVGDLEYEEGEGRGWYANFVLGWIRKDASDTFACNADAAKHVVDTMHQRGTLPLAKCKDPECRICWIRQVVPDL